MLTTIILSSVDAADMNTSVYVGPHFLRIKTSLFYSNISVCVVGPHLLMKVWHKFELMVG